MPRGFLVKRTSTTVPYSYRNRKVSEDERSDSGSDLEYIHTNFGSPDSGYSASPICLTFRERELIGSDKDSRSSTPITVSSPNHTSPFYFSTFDRLSVSSQNPLQIPFNNNNTPDKLSRNTDSNVVLTSPNKKRVNNDQENKVSKTPKKPKAARKINFDEDKSSPVSGTIIKEFSDEDVGRHVCGDIDSAFNFVEITPEAKADIEKIENKIGDYDCQLCKEHYEDAFQLAQHRCSRIVHVEYRCPECDKVFNCPANLASHRRWHKPRGMQGPKTATPSRILPAGPLLNTNSIPRQGEDENSNVRMFPESSEILDNTNRLKVISPNSDDGQFECDQCGKKFKRQAYLRKHIQNHSNDSLVTKLSFSNNETRETVDTTENGNAELSCAVCFSALPNKVAFEKHMRGHGNETYTCKYCASIFYSSPGLTRHINKCHPSENRQVILLQVPVNRPC